MDFKQPVSTQRLVAAVRDARPTMLCDVARGPVRDGRVWGLAGGLDLAKVVAA